MEDKMEQSSNHTYRNLFKWGKPELEETLDQGMKKLIKETFGIDADLIKEKELPGKTTVSLPQKSRLNSKQMKELKEIVGEENAAFDDTARATHAYGKTYLDLIRLRDEIIENPPDAVIYPRNEEDIKKIISWCNENKIPLIPFGGHSSVTRGLECLNGGISLDITQHFNKVLKINEINSTAIVQTGIYGPALEDFLNKRGYTCGHFPQSFEFSTLGGWIVTRGAGQQSTSYGKIEDMIIASRFVTPTGVLQTREYPAASIGPDLDQIIAGSEGAFGVLTVVTLKIRKYLPQNNRYFSFLFKDFESALETMRLTMQGQFGYPSMFRLSDPEETDVAFKIKNFEGTALDYGLRFLGYKPLKRCLLYVSTVGNREYGKVIQTMISHIARRKGALSMGAKPALKWLAQRYSSAYLRDPLMDIGIRVDTLETAVPWEKIKLVWQETIKAIKIAENAVSMIHISHVYENGANLYFTFLTKMSDNNEIEDYLAYQKTIIDAIHENGGSLSHHHGIGKMLGTWMESEVGQTGMELLTALKKHFDPNNIMNPGGTLGIKDY